MYDFDEFLERAKLYDRKSAIALAVKEIYEIDHMLKIRGKGADTFNNKAAANYRSELKKFRNYMDQLFAGNPVPVEILTEYKSILDVYRDVYPELKKRLDEIPNDPECKSKYWSDE